MTIAEELDLLVQSIDSIPSDKKYWLIRTQSGSLYDKFRDYRYVSLEHNELPLSFLYEKKKEFGTDTVKRYEAIREAVRTQHKLLKNTQKDEDIDLRRASIVASQISKFVFELKKGDIVIIPSANLEKISIGIILENHIAEFSEQESKMVDDFSILKRRVNWIEDIKRQNIDPYLYKIFSAHQAICDVSNYGEVIERSFNDVFIYDDEAHYIINVLSTENIPAKDLFGLGSKILCLIDDLAKEFNLDIKSDDLQVTININSPGKIDLKSKIRSTTIMAGILLLVCGGGYEDADGTKISTEGMPGIIKAVDNFLNHNSEREMKRQVFDKYKDSLNIKQPYDMLKLLKQFSENKDLPQ